MGSDQMPPVRLSGCLRKWGHTSCLALLFLGLLSGCASSVPPSRLGEYVGPQALSEGVAPV